MKFIFLILVFFWPLTANAFEFQNDNLNNKPLFIFVEENQSSLSIDYLSNKSYNTELLKLYGNRLKKNLLNNLKNQLKSHTTDNQYKKIMFGGFIIGQGFKFFQNEAKGSIKFNNFTFTIKSGLKKPSVFEIKYSLPKNRNIYNGEIKGQITTKGEFLIQFKLKF